MALDGSEYWSMLVKRGLSRFLLLAVLHEGPVHGYDIGRRMREACRGCCEPTDGTIYPTLKELMDGDYIVCQEEKQDGRVRKVCHLTARGEEAFRAAARAWSEAVPHILRAAKAARIGLTCDQQVTQTEPAETQNDTQEEHDGKP